MICFVKGNYTKLCYHSPKIWKSLFYLHLCFISINFIAIISKYQQGSVLALPNLILHFFCYNRAIINTLSWPWTFCWKFIFSIIRMKLRTIITTESYNISNKVITKTPWTFSIKRCPSIVIAEFTFACISS